MDTARLAPQPHRTARSPLRAAAGVQKRRRVFNSSFFCSVPAAAPKAFGAVRFGCGPVMRDSFATSSLPFSCELSLLFYRSLMVAVAAFLHLINLAAAN
jgi:hypothetical protein